MKDYLLVYPTKAHEEEALAYIEEFRQMGSKLNGTGGLDRISDYGEWLRAGAGSGSAQYPGRQGSGAHVLSDAGGRTPGYTG